jgi:basic amino acid/polyamine antiporter, APA family
VATMWAFNGWDGVTYISGEVRNPAKAIPISILSGTGLAIAVYMGINVAVQYALPVDAIAQSALPAATALELVIGHSGAALVSVAMAVAMLTTLNGGVMGSPRVAFAAVENSNLSFIAKVHPRFRTPSRALLIQAGVTFLLILSGGSFRDLFSLVISTGWLWSIIGASAIFVFRRNEPRVEGAYRMWGYPYIPILFIASVAVVLFYAFADSPWKSVVALAGILLGAPVFYLSRKRNKSLYFSARPTPALHDEIMTMAARAKAE